MTLIGAMAQRGMVGEMTLPLATDGSAFKTYVTQILAPNLWAGACVIMDNLPAHKVAGIKEAIEAVGATVVYLSPYSPDFSPIENCWSKLKEFLRARAKNLCRAKLCNRRCSCRRDDQGHYRLVYPLLLLYFTQLRTAVSIVVEEGQQSIRGSPQEKAKEMAISTYRDRSIIKT